MFTLHSQFMSATFIVFANWCLPFYAARSHVIYSRLWWWIS